MNTPEGWLSLANDDLAAAEFLAANMYPVPVQIVCFHCQQAGEKYLKGYLATKITDEPPYIHDLAKLCKLCMQFDADFSRMSIAASVLTDFSVKTRYDDGIYPTEDEMKNGLACAKQIRDFVLERMA